MAFKMKINGVEKQCMRTGHVNDGMERIVVICENGLNESEHRVPKDWLDMDARGVAALGENRYELLR